MSRTQLASPCWVVGFAADIGHAWQHHRLSRGAVAERDSVAAAARRNFEPDVAKAVASAPVRPRLLTCVEVRCDACDAEIHIADTTTTAIESQGWSSDGAGRDHCPSCPEVAGSVEGQLSFDDDVLSVWAFTAAT